MSIATHPTLSRTDAALLSAATGRPHGRIVLPEAMTPLAVKRTLGRFLKRGLIEPREAAGETAHDLTPAGYAAVGMTPPRPPMLAVAAVAEDSAGPIAVSKRELVLGLLGRPEGASMPELIAATSWLPHTTRAVLSRLRSAGQVLDKSERADGATAYRIVPVAPAPPARGPGRRKGIASQATAA